MNKLEKIFKTHTLSGRLRTFIINLILFVFLVITIFLLFMTKSQIKTTYQNELDAIVSMQNQTVEKWLNERELDIRFLVNNEDVKSKKFKKVKSLFENFVNSQSEFYFVTLINLEGYSEVDSTFGTKRYFGNKEFFKESLNGLDVISDAMINEFDQVPVIHFSSPVFDEYNNVSAVVVGAVRLNSVQRIIENFRFGKTGETFILNNKKQFLTKRKFDKDNNILKHIDNSKIRKDFYINYNNQEVLGTFEKSNFDRWTIVAQISKNEMYEMLEQFLLYISAFIITLLILIIPLILRFSNKIERPLQFLLNGSKQIEEGDYGHKIDSDLIVYATNEIKELTHSFNSMSDVLKNVIGDLTTHSTIDMLSKLYNRRELLRLSTNLLEKSKLEKKHIAIFMIDIDHFKRINDTYGHRTGDVAIEMISNTIKTSITNVDIAGRYGGEEFMVFIEDTSYENVKCIAQRIRRNVEKLVIVNDEHQLSCTCSIGVYFMVDLNMQLKLDTAIEKADQALYKAKHTGRNKTVIFKD